MKKLRIVLFTLAVLTVPFLFAPQTRAQVSTVAHIYTENWFESSFQMNVTTEDTWTVGGLYPVIVDFKVTRMGENKSILLDRIEVGLTATGVKKNQSINKQLSYIGETHIVVFILNASDPLFTWIRPGETNPYVFFVDVRGKITDTFTNQTWYGSAFETFLVKVYSPLAPIKIITNLTPDIRVGDDFKLQISVRNEGDYPITSLKVNLWEPYGATITGEKNMTIPILEPKRTVPLTFILRADKVGSYLMTFETSYLSYSGYRVWRIDDISLTIGKMLSYITCSVSPETIVQGGNITVSGIVSPANEAIVTLTFRRPDGKVVTRVTRSGTDGSFNYRFTPDVGGSWTVEASWTGDFDTGGATSPTIPFICKEFSYITCSVSPETITQGGKVTVSGAISPVHGAIVTLTFKRPDGSTVARYIRSSAQGVFDYLFTPDVGGSWTVEASWTGDFDTGGATSPTIPFICKEFSYILCSVSPETFTQGGNVTVSGAISPIHEALVTLTFKRPDGRAVTRVTYSGKDGSFTYRFFPDVAGSWTVEASWLGDLDTGGATSPTVAFMVRTQERALGYEMIVLYIVVIAVVVLVSYRFVFRRKRVTRRTL